MKHEVPNTSEDGAAQWLNAAYQVLVSEGVDKIRIATLAEGLATTRTAFYWYFDGREALLDALVAQWQAKNTGNFIAKVSAYAASINEAVFNMFDCWLDPALFDAPFDLAIRNWSKGDPALAVKVAEADRMRIEALIAMFARHGYAPREAFTRAHTVYYVQIGYISMLVVDEPAERLARMPDYVAVYTGVAPSATEIERFMARHVT